MRIPMDHAGMVPIRRPVGLFGSGSVDLFGNPIVEQPRRSSTTTDAFCSIEWDRVAPLVVHSHDVKAAFKFLGGEYEGHVMVVIDKDEDEENVPFNDIAEAAASGRLRLRRRTRREGYFVKGSEVRHFIGLREVVAERLMATPEGGIFKYRNIKRHRLTRDEIMGLLGGRTLIDGDCVTFGDDLER